MRKLAQMLDFTVRPSKLLSRCSRRLGDMFGWYDVQGYYKSFPVSITTARYPSMPVCPVRIVARLSLEPRGDFSIYLKGRPWCEVLQRWFERGWLPVEHPLLAPRITVSTDYPRLCRYLLEFEEIIESICAVWPTRSAQGTLIINERGIVYHEPFRMIRENTRQRLCAVVKLLGEVADVLRFFFRKDESFLDASVLSFGDQEKS